MDDSILSLMHGRHMKNWQYLHYIPYHKNYSYHNNGRTFNIHIHKSYEFYKMYVHTTSSVFTL